VKKPSPPPAAEKDGLHPRNRHRARYDFAQLVAGSPGLAPFVRPNPYQDLSIDFANPAAVKALNQALLKQFYGIAAWDLPAGYLCPPIPGRADYLHYLADLLAADNAGAVPRGPGIRVLDVGMGANCIYPILGHREYGWQFVGTDIDPTALGVARQLVAANPALTGALTGRRQPDPAAVFEGVIRADEQFDLTLCNPPFHASAAEAAAGTGRKLRNLDPAAGGRPVRNFAGRPGELWCPGGEVGFVRRMVAESVRFATQGYWFTSWFQRRIRCRVFTRRCTTWGRSTCAPWPWPRAKKPAASWPGRSSTPRNERRGARPAGPAPPPPPEAPARRASLFRIFAFIHNLLLTLRCCSLAKQKPRNSRIHHG